MVYSMSFEIITRQAVESDLPDVTALTKALWLEHAAHATDLQHADRIQAYDYESHVAASFSSPNDQWFVALDEQYVAGAVRTELETDRNPLYRHSEALYIDDIAVDIDFRRRGVGWLLVNACVDYAKERHIELLQAMIYDWNSPSIQLFEGAGFVSRRGDFFRVNTWSGI